MCRGIPGRSRFVQRPTWQSSGPVAASDPQQPAQDTTVTDLQFEIELEEPVVEQTRKEQFHFDEETRHLIKCLMSPEDGFCRQLSADVNYILSQWKRKGLSSSSTIVDLGRELCKRDYKVHLRAGLGLKKKTVFMPNGDPKPVFNSNAKCLEVLRHKFLMVEQVVTGIKGRVIQSREVVVQPYFRQHFVLPVMSNRYKKLLELVPEVYAGGRTRLKKQLEVLCSEADVSFKGFDWEVPPWRYLNSTISKWCPKRFEAYDFIMDGHHATVRKRISASEWPYSRGTRAGKGIISQSPRTSLDTRILASNSALVA